MEAKITEIIAALKLLSDPVRTENAKTYCPTSMEVLGITSPQLKSVVKELWTNECKSYSPRELIEFAKKLTATAMFECQMVAFSLLWNNKKALSALVLDDLLRLGQNLDNWASVDSFSIMLSGWAWREGQIGDDVVLDWLASENRWWRRVAVVSTVALNLKSRGGKGDTPRTLMICEKVIADRDDMVVKALSWALRELSKKDKPAVEDFMAKYEHLVAGRVRREVNLKLTTGKKNG